MKRFTKPFNFLLIIITLGAFTACDKNNNVALFSVQNDIELGQQVSAEIENDPNFDLMSRSEYPEAYNYLDDMVNEILNSGEVAYRQEFAWDVTLVKNDSTLNAFAAPGGYIYVYTGLIKYLDNADDLAGVIGHEIAHADLRHTSRNLQRQYGVSILLSIILGNDASKLEQIAGQIAGTLAGLEFSKEFEEEADAKSVVYLADTKYACNGAASFFVKLEEQGQTGGPEFLSTHPNPGNRVADINAKADEVGCDTTPIGGDGYAQFKADLP
ncbi:peptidase M48 [Fulvivirga sp. RKSG066]|nr:M48 family metalloprotease [Fulvivirga aurantia]MTI19516.1 peptidase M48 [Fulvivirga aurantia]